MPGGAFGLAPGRRGRRRVRGAVVARQDAHVDHADRAAAFAKASAQLANEPFTFKSGATGTMHANPLVQVLDRHTSQMFKAIDHLGFSPASRAALGRSGPEFTNATPTQIGQPRANPRLAAYLDAKPDKTN